jgi:uncharacterized iron-regulated protein
MKTYRLKRSTRLLAGSALLVFLILLPPLVDAAGENLIFKVKNISQISLDGLVRDLEGTKVITIGEQHDNRDHHTAQLRLIAALHEADMEVAVGFEQFGVRSQPGLDDWIAGKSGIDDLFEIYSLDWELNWWPLYLPIFEYAREHEIPMVGLNIPREIVRQVASRGFSSLSAEQRGKIRVLSCNIDQKYQDTLSRLVGHKRMQPGNTVFQKFCEAQVVWDTSMALNAVDYIKANPGRVLVILAGSFHAWKRGIPEQIRRVADMPVKTILPSEDTSFFNYNVLLEDADYVWWFE